MGRRFLVVLAALAVAGAAFAQCPRGPDTAEVTLPGFLSVYYQQFRSDAAADVAEFYGGVCVTAVGGEWTVFADSVRLSSLSTDVQLAAPSPELFLGPWRMTAGMLVANAERLRLQDANVEGPDASGAARVLEIDLNTSEITLQGVVLAGSAFALRGEHAVMRGAALEIDVAGVTSCIGVEPVPYEIEGLRAEADLDARSVVLRGGTLRVGSLRIPLRDEVELSEESFARLDLPVKVQYLQGDPNAPRYGEGLALRVVGIPLANGVQLDVGATGLDAEYPLVATGLVRVEEPVDLAEGTSGAQHQGSSGAQHQGSLGAPHQVSHAVFGVESGAPYLDVGVTRTLTPWLDLILGARSGAEPAKDALHQGSVRLRAATPVPAVRGEVAGEVFFAATAVVPARVEGAVDVTPSVFGTRVGAAVEGRMASSVTSAGSFALDARAEGTLYPAHDVAQWGVRLAPSWRYASGPFNATFSYDARFTNAASPFGAGVDLLAPRQRAAASLRVAGVLASWPEDVGAGLSARELRGSADVRASHDFVPVDGEPAGVRSLRATVGATYDAEPWRFEVNAATELAGAVDVATGRDAYFEVGVAAYRAGWPVLFAASPGGATPAGPNPSRPQPPTPYGTFEVGVRSQFGLVPTDSGLRRLELRAGVPLAFDTFEFRPFAAIDFAPTLLHGELPALSGVGLDVTFVTCCGSLTVGVVNDRGSWAASVAVDLERRPPAERSAGAPSGSGASSDAASGAGADADGFDPTEQPAADGATGIMSRSP